MPSFNNSIIKYMKTKEIFWVPNPSYIIGDYKVVINDSISMRLHLALGKLLSSIHEAHPDDNIALKRFVSYVAVDFFLPVQVLIISHNPKD